MRCDIIFTLLLGLISFSASAQLSSEQIKAALEGLNDNDKREILNTMLDEGEVDAADIIMARFEQLSPDAQSKVVGAILSKGSIPLKEAASTSNSNAGDSVKENPSDVAFETPKEKPVLVEVEPTPKTKPPMPTPKEEEPSAATEPEPAISDYPDEEDIDMEITIVPSTPEAGIAESTLAEKRDELTDKGEEAVSEASEEAPKKKRPRRELTQEEALKFAQAEWDEMLYDFGEIVQGEKRTHTFTVTNYGLIPLELTDAKASCGCTIPEYSDKPIPPGESGQVTVVFDSSKKMGKVHQGIVVYNNTINRRSIIYIRGNIVKKGGEAPTPEETDGE